MPWSEKFICLKIKVKETSLSSCCLLPMFLAWKHKRDGHICWLACNNKYHEKSLQCIINQETTLLSVIVFFVRHRMFPSLQGFRTMKKTSTSDEAWSKHPTSVPQAMLICKRTNHRAKYQCQPTERKMSVEITHEPF